MDFPDPWLVERLSKAKGPPAPTPPPPPPPVSVKDKLVRNLELIKYFSTGRRRADTPTYRHFNNVIVRAKKSLWVRVVVGWRIRREKAMRGNMSRDNMIRDADDDDE